MRVLIHVVWPVKAWEMPSAETLRLRAAFPDIEFMQAFDADAAHEYIEGADVALASSLKPAMVGRARRLRWVHSTASAVSGLLPLAELDARGIVVSNSKGVQAVSIAEHVMGGLLVLSRRLNLALDAQRRRRWIQEQLSSTDWPWMLRGRSMTIVGLGTIGMEVARRAAAFGMKVTGVRRRPGEPVPAIVQTVVGPEQLDQVLRGTDVLVVSAPFVGATDRLINASRLDLLNTGAVVVNVARGQIIDGAALLERLQSRRLGGAVLDVFDNEPLPQDSPLWDMPNAILTPHCSGFRADHWAEVTDLYIDNLRRFRKGEPLLNVVDCRAGY